MQKCNYFVIHRYIIILRRNIIIFKYLLPLSHIRSTGETQKCKMYIIKFYPFRATYNSNVSSECYEAFEHF